jgi:ribonuclease HI
MPRTPSSKAAGARLFAEAPAEQKAAGPAFRANVDGAARGNPGPAAYGVMIRDGKGEVVGRLKKYIGRMTNNVAEYYGLIAALDYAQSHGVKALRVESDSELMVKQMRGQYKVKSEDLRPLYEQATKMAKGLESFRIDHVYREQNREADALANQALDETAGGAPAAGAPAKAAAASGDGAKAAGPRWIQARFRSGILYPLEDIDLPDGTEVEFTLRPSRKPTPTR